jgi:hypothetical protein
MKPVAESSKAADTEVFEAAVGVWKPPKEKGGISAAQSAHPVADNQSNDQTKQLTQLEQMIMPLNNQIKSAEEAIAEMELNAIQNRNTYMKVDAWILTDNNFDSVDGVLYIEPDLCVHSTQVVGDSIAGLYERTVSSMMTCGECRYMGNGQCEAFLPPEGDIFQIYEVSASTPACAMFAKGEADHV